MTAGLTAGSLLPYFLFLSFKKKGKGKKRNPRAVNPISSSPPSRACHGGDEWNEDMDRALLFLLFLFFPEREERKEEKRNSSEPGIYLNEFRKDEVRMKTDYVSKLEEKKGTVGHNLISTLHLYFAGASTPRKVRS